jgi:hypothetical protein
MLYSHIWDLILKAALLLGLVLLAIGLGIDQSLGVWPMIVIVGVLWFVIYRWGLSTVSAWLYARINLGTSVSFSEARRLTRVFQLDVSGKWLPFNEVKKLPPEQRHAALLAGLESALPNRKAMLV